MKFGLSIPQFDAFADVNLLANLAKEAEEAGWDGFFIWDHILFDDMWRPVVDPWIVLTAIAIRTKTIHMGPMITPLARRRPWKVAREAISLDQLSDGRLIIGVGLGAPEQWEFGFFGEEMDAKIRARKLDEGLEILVGLLSGELFSYKGEFFNLKEMRFLPKPVQKPRVPIWVGGTWPNKRPIYRAAKYDGYFPDAVISPVSPQDWIEIQELIASHRGSVVDFDLVQYGVTPGEDPVAGYSIVAPYEEVGVNWWVEGVSPFDYGFGMTDAWTDEIVEKLIQRVRLGPPKSKD
jgi:alkanesulfonate monooxygenase SsuD/methylene tetrahydromethanopterin reductase-like flavin-dependent oxidoreductase (luciferase family)